MSHTTIGTLLFTFEGRLVIYALHLVKNVIVINTITVFLIVKVSLLPTPL